MRGVAATKHAQQWLKLSHLPCKYCDALSFFSWLSVLVASGIFQ